MLLTGYISSTIKNAIRKLTVVRFGKTDIVTANECLPFGVDSQGIPNMIAVYSDTKINGEPVIIGWLNRSAIANVGEIRLFSTDSSGSPVYNVKLSNEGILYMGVSKNFDTSYNDFLVKFNELKAGFDQLVNDYNAHTHETGTGESSIPTTLSVASIDASKISNIKVE